MREVVQSKDRVQARKQQNSNLSQLLYVQNDKKVSKDMPQRDLLFGGAMDTQQSKHPRMLTFLQMLTIALSIFNRDKQWTMIPWK